MFIPPKKPNKGINISTLSLSISLSSLSLSLRLDVQNLLLLLKQAVANSEHLILISKINISMTLIHEQILCTQKKILTCLSAPVTIVSRFLSSHFKNGLNSSLTTPADISSACFVFVHSSREVSINLQKEPIHELTTIFTLGNSIIYSLAFECYEHSSLPLFIVLEFLINKTTF